MWELLRDPVWQGVGAVITVLSLITSVTLGTVVYLLQRRRKELGYRVLSQTRVVSIEAEVAEQVQVLYEGQPVRDVHLVEVEVVNSGNEAIVEKDYQYPLAIRTGHKSRVLTAVLVDSEPEDLPAWPIIPESPDFVRVQPLLLNPGDWFKVRILVSEFAGVVDVGTRIVGAKEIRHLGDEPGKARTAMTMAVAIALYGLPIGVALVKGIEALFAVSWLGVFGWSAVLAVVITVWAKWGAPMINRYLTS